jgi:hypothetical protein
MPLNTTGPISLAGATAGQSIAVELGLSATGTISLNQTNVRTLAGVASGAIIMPTNFYGKSNFTPAGQATYSSIGTYSYVVPAGVSSICAVCVGAGGSGTVGGNTGGGGALSYSNDIPVTAGETLTVFVGDSAIIINSPSTPTVSQDSYIARGGTILLLAKGGSTATAYPSASGGGSAAAGVGAVRFSGGNCFDTAGGGAAGYAANGATSPGPSVSGSTNGSGGGGASGNNTTGEAAGQAGGGVGLVVQGANGVAPNGGGSGGTNGNTGVGIGTGGIHGGGGRGHGDGSGGRGGFGGVRIIWGTGKSYPFNSVV